MKPMTIYYALPPGRPRDIMIALGWEAAFPLNWERITRLAQVENQ
jgi:hypothetical protein